MYKGALPTCMSVYCVHAWYPQKLDEGIGSYEAGVTDGCGLPCGSSVGAIHALNQ